MRKYDNYKDSGIEWIGEIPEHWEVKKLKRLAKIGNGQDHKNVWDSSGKYPIIGTGGEFGKANTYLHKGPSVILGRKGTIDKPQYIDTPFWSVDTAYFTDIYQSVNPKLFYYLCTTINFDLHKYGSAVPSMTQEVLTQIPFVIPNTIEEQNAIASYLDRKTAEIDELIADKKRLLELYEEEKTAIINQAVTKGINPDVPMKDSGVEWLGEIPVHWEVKRIDRIANIVRGNTGFKKDELLDDGEYIALQYGKTYKVHEINGSFNFFVNSEFYKSNQIVQFDDVILISTSETLEDLGHSCFYAREDIGLLGGEQILLRPISSSVSGKYLYYSSKVFCVQLRKFARGIKVFRFNIDNLKETYTVIPSIDDQNLIVQHIDNEITRLDVKKSKTEKLIELLTEYRTALISEVVTGKIRVT